MLRTCWVVWLAPLALLSACSVDGADRSSDSDGASGAANQDATSEAEGGAPSDAGQAADTGGSASMDASSMDAGMQPGSDGSSGDAGCSGASCERCKNALYVVADFSNSMTQSLRMGSALIGDAGARDASTGDAGDAGDAGTPSTNARYEAMKNALHAFIDDPSVASTRLGLGHFPLAPKPEGDAGTPCAPGTECTAVGGSCCPGGALCLSGFGCFGAAVLGPSCVVADYATPDVELGEPAAVAAALHAKLMTLGPSGQSPEITALEGALSYAQGKLAPGSKVSVVLFADGAWNSCAPSDAGVDGSVQLGGPVEPLLAVAARYAMGASPVNTYVLAIDGEPDAGADASSGPAYFDPVAAAGGTVRAYNGRSADEMLSALKAIREHAAAACK